MQLRIGSGLNSFERSNKINRLGCFVAVLLLLGIGCVNGATRAHSQTSPKRHATSSRAGQLKIFVPVGMIGDDFWLYLNDHLESSPPHGTPEIADRDFIQVPLHKGGINGPPNGWEIWGTKGRYLAMSQEIFTGLNGFVHSGNKAVEQLFQPVVLTLKPAKYSLELVISSTGNRPNSFPFVVTRKYEVTVPGGDTAQLYIAVPDNWSGTPTAMALPVNRVCPQAIWGQTPQAPDLDQLQRWINDYDSDPMVQVLHRAVAARSARSKTVVLNLPPSQGGSREFDDRQVRNIVAALEGSHSLPTHREVKQCMEKAPQFTRTYTEYDRLLTDLDQEIESFRKLAGN